MEHSVHISTFFYNKQIEILFVPICFICRRNIFLNPFSSNIDTGRSRLPAFPLVYAVALESSKIKISRGKQIEEKPMSDHILCLR